MRGTTVIVLTTAKALASAGEIIYVPRQLYAKTTIIVVQVRDVLVKRAAPQMCVYPFAQAGKSQGGMLKRQSWNGLRFSRRLLGRGLEADELVKSCYIFHYILYLMSNQYICA